MENPIVTIPDFAGTPSEYHGAAWYQYDFEGNRAMVCIPKNIKEGVPFMWRTEFFGAFDSVDREMLHRGYPLVHYSISDLFGSDEAVEMMKRFYDHVVKEWHLSEKCIPEGFSRGGMYAVNFAAAYPETVTALYLDAPVLDIKSWPLGLGVGTGSEYDTKLVYQLFHLDPISARSFDKNPIDRVPKLIENNIPVMLVAGDSDDLVPFKENGERLINLYRASGATCTRIIKPGCNHHPHSLEEPSPICNVIEKFCAERA